MLSTLLRDGRTIAFREYGTGFPVIFMHGNLNSRNFAPAWLKSSDQADTAGARVIAVDRPGYGGSTYHKDRQYKDFAHDIDELATYLQLDAYAVLGYSSGGPHAMVCAAFNLQNKVKCCGLLSSDGPYFILNEVESVYGSSNVNLEYSVTLTRKNVDSLREAYTGMKDEQRKELALSDLNTAVEQGLEGAASDGVLEAAESWGFDIRDIKIPTLLWHGNDDKDVSVNHGQYIADNISSDYITSNFIDGENHSMIRRRWGEALTDIVSLANK
jgi:pimeloyl-ACP methyl ester carboxylesterase